MTSTYYQSWWQITKNHLGTYFISILGTFNKIWNWSISKQGRELERIIVVIKWWSKKNHSGPSFIFQLTRLLFGLRRLSIRQQYYFINWEQMGLKIWLGWEQGLRMNCTKKSLRQIFSSLDMRSFWTAAKLRSFNRCFFHCFVIGYCCHTISPFLLRLK